MLPEKGMDMAATTHVNSVPLLPGPESEDGQARGLLDMAFHAFVEVRPGGFLTEWNAQAEITFGWPRAEAVGKDLASLIVSLPGRGLFQKSLQEFLDPGMGPAQTKQVEITALHREGHEFPVELTIFVSACNETPRLGIFVRDLRPSTSMEEEIEKRRRFLADQLAEAYHEVDLRGSFTFINKQCQALNIWDGSHTGVNYKQIFVSEEAAGVRDLYHEIYRTGKPARIEYPRTQDGQTRFHEESVSLLRDAAGNAIGFAVLTRDCTKRKRNEMEMAKAREAAEAANRAKSEFLANMSHELRTPLNGVMGMLELVSLTKITAEQRELLKMAKTAANSLLTVINDILDFSKIEAGRLKLDCTGFDLAGTVVDVMQAQSVSAGHKGLELVYEIAPDVPRSLSGDCVRLKQVLTNLLGNAVKFAERGEVALRIERAEEQPSDPSQMKLRFSISDTGIGIADDKQRLIFEAFSQADGSATRKHGGTGLGLAICWPIVKLMGGNLWVKSKLHEGSTFYFTADFAIGHPVVANGPERPLPVLPHPVSDAEGFSGQRPEA